MKSNKFIALLCMLLLACSTSSLLAADTNLKTIRFGVSFIPNVQFAPIYVAQKMGFYAEQGLKVEVEYGYENDFVALAAQGEREFALGSGDQVILARSQGVPIVYVMKWHQRFPVALMAPKSKNIKSVKDLVGKSVGIPGFFGASYVGWKALLFASGVDETKVTVKQIGFTQASAVQQNIVDSAVVYIVNEPIQLRKAGIEVDVIEVSDHIDLVSNGLLVGEKLIKEDPETVKRMVSATIKGLNYAIANPKKAFDISRTVIPELTDKDAPVQFEVLKASALLWQSKTMGISTKKSWEESVIFMQKTGLLNRPVMVDKLFTNRFIEK
ncbi:MAG: ABC transporter substrate-binding protein [Proteobacteria bacterium]|nr:ABC transporter substrate-binding protein [Pseudomonadota bacterium]